MSVAWKKHIPVQEAEESFMSVAWEKHKPVHEAEESFMSVFSRCYGDEARRYFSAEVAKFRNESAQKLILGDLMLLNPQQEQAR